MRRIIGTGLCSLVLALNFSSAPLRADTIIINFDDQPGGIPPVPTTGTFNPFATFSTSANATLLIFEGAGFVGGSPPNTLTAAVDPSGSVFDADVYVSFTQPANDLTFNVLADNDAGAIGNVRVFTNGSFAGTVGIVGNGNFSDPIPIDLSSYIDVTRLEIVDITDEFGLSYDDFMFTVPVPEPTSFALALVAILALWHLRK